MKEFSITNNEKLKRIDPVVLFCVLGMNLMSIVTLLASSDAYGTWYVKVQALASLIGFVGMVVITFIDYDALITKLKYVFFALSVVLMVRKGKHGQQKLAPLAVLQPVVAAVGVCQDNVHGLLCPPPRLPQG